MFESPPVEQLHTCAAPMASPAFELLSQQFMRRCSTAPSQLARRQASTSSSAQHKISEHLGRLQLDISQRRADRVWRGLRILRDLSPSSITAELLAASIPLLAGSYKSSLGKHVRHEEPADAARRAVRVQEEAETLYAKYRFVCTCLEQKALKPLNAKTVFGWAKAFEELGYAPAAWRLWNDRRKLADAAETQAAQAEDLGLLSHSVLIASIRYLRLREGSDSIEEIRKEVRGRPPEPPRSVRLIPDIGPRCNDTHLRLFARVRTARSDVTIAADSHRACLL